MARYRVMFRNLSGYIVGREDFTAEEDVTAVVIADTVFHACSDCVTGYSLWCGDRLVLAPRPQPPTMAEIREKRQADIIELEEAILDSKSAIASSILLLTRFDEWGKRNFRPK